MEGTCGSPEKPLSDLGKLSYRSYWSFTLLSLLKEDTMLSIEDLSKLTGFTKIDIIETLNSLGLIKYWKSEKMVCATSKQVDELLRSLEPNHSRSQVELDPACLHWQPGFGHSDCAEPAAPKSARSSSSKH